MSTTTDYGSASWVKICNAIIEDTLPTNNAVKNKTTTKKRTVSKPVATKTQYSYKTQKARTDKRVSLNVSPLKFDKNGNFNPANEPFAQRIAYVLGSGIKKLPNGQTVYGFLNSCLSKSCGLIFPYTPNITVSHSVNYDSSEITHSNLNTLHYKNTPPPTYQMEATFTADTYENALHMLSAIWFLRAVTKCDFGEQANERGVAGMPPPVLYLNGYNQIMDNIPVVVKSFSYSLPSDKDYVALGINLDKSNFLYTDRKLYSDVNGNFYDNEDYTASSDGLKYINGIANAIKGLQEQETTLPSNRYNTCYFNNWLPTEMTFSISLEVQPNLMKYKKQFNLDEYKMGIYNLDAYKGGTKVYITTKTGVEDCSDVLSVDIVDTIKEKVQGLTQSVTKNFDISKIASDAVKKYGSSVTTTIEDGSVYNTVKTNQTITLTKDETQKVLSGFSSGLTSKSYKFDRSGFTW